MGAGELPFTSAPYPGLRPFAAEESDIFFGREAQIDKLLEKLQHNRFLALVGASGCGKSSLVRAGLIAGLEAGFMGSSGHRWRIADLRPGNEPLLRLSEALLDPRALGAELGASTSLAAVHAQLRRGPLGLVELVREARLPEGTNLLVLVDQFEEIFRFRRLGNPNTADAFVALLLESARHREQPVFVVLTMRSDFLGDCAVFRGLPEAISESEFLTPRLTREQIRQAIAGPARVFGGDVDPALVNRLINDVGPDPDQLPVLQHALMRMWSRAESRAHAAAGGSPLITLEDYAAIGGLKTALSNHGDEILSGLSVERQRLAQTMFSWLTERGEGRRDTRRPATVREIAEIAHAAPEEVAAVADSFRVPGVSFLTPPYFVPLTTDSVLDISHESLIRGWAKLAAWVEQEAERASIYVRLKQAAELWKQGTADLWSGRQINNAMSWAQAVKPTAAWALRYGSSADFESAMAFLAASRRSWIWRGCWRGALATLAATGVIGSGAVYLVLTHSAAQEALSRELAMESRRLLALDQDRALQKAHAALRESKTEQALRVAAEVLDARLEQARFQSEHNETVLGAGFAERAPAALVLEDSGVVRLAGLSGGQTIATLELPGWRPSMVAFSAQGGRVALARAPDRKAEVSRITLWDPAVGRSPLPSVEYPASINAIALSPTGERAAFAASDRVLAVLEYGKNTVKPLGELPRGPHKVAFSPSGRYLLAYPHEAGAHFDRARVVVCDVERATCRRVALPWMEGHEDLEGAWFAFDDAHLVTVSSRSGLVLRLWNLTGRPRAIKIATPDLAMHVLRAGNTDPRGEHLALIDEVNGSVHVIEIRTGREVGRFRPPADSQALGASFAPDGRLVTTSHLDRTARLWRMPSQLLSANIGEVRSLALSSDGGVVALGSDHGAAYLLDGSDLHQRFELSYDTPPDLRRAGQRVPNFVHFVGFDASGKRLLAAYEDAYVRVWDTRDGKLLARTQAPHGARVRCASFSPDGSLILTASEDGRVAVWNARNGSMTAERRLPSGEGGDHRFPVCASFGRDANTVTVFSNGGEVWRWTLAGDQWEKDPLFLYAPVRVTTDASANLVAVQPSYGGAESLLIFRGAPKDRTVQCGTRRRAGEHSSQTDAVRPDSPLQLPLPGGRFVTNFTSDGRLVATINEERTVTVWRACLADARSGAVPRPVTRSGPADLAAISPDGRRIVMFDSGRISIRQCRACRAMTNADAEQVLARTELLKGLDSAMKSLAQTRRQSDETSDTGVAAVRARDGYLG